MLACDAGNTRIKIGLFDTSSGSTALPECLAHGDCAAAAEVPWSDLAPWLSDLPEDTFCCLMGSNPAAVERVGEEWARQPAEMPLHTLGDATDLLQVRVEEPGKVGVDRLLNAIAANVVRRLDQPAVIIDSGTATTVDLVDENGAFQGGAISARL